jgi:quercetin dioxygenase-like cupin family protein
MLTRCGCLADTAPVVTRGESDAAFSFGCQTTRIVVPAEATNGACAIWMHVAHPGFSPPRHIHQREDEIIHVLDGELYVWCDGATFTVNPGDTAARPAAQLPRDGA